MCQAWSWQDLPPAKVATPWPLTSAATAVVLLIQPNRRETLLIKLQGKMARGVGISFQFFT